MYDITTQVCHSVLPSLVCLVSHGSSRKRYDTYECCFSAVSVSIISRSCCRLFSCFRCNQGKQMQTLKLED